MLTDDEIEQRAEHMREWLGISSLDRPDMMTVIHKAKSTFKKFNYLRVPDRELPNAEAQWNSERGTVLIRESVFIAMQQGNPRARMTVAHEIGHFGLRHTGIRNRSVSPSKIEKFHGGTRKDEREARRFAAALLAPARLIHPDDSAEAIAERFGLSIEAATIRKNEVQLMRVRASGERRALPQAVVDFLRERERRGVNPKNGH